jgi:hypothetical protein
MFHNRQFNLLFMLNLFEINYIFKTHSNNIIIFIYLY